MSVEFIDSRNQSDFVFFLERKRMAEVFLCDFPHITLEEEVVLVTHLASVSI